MDLNHPEKFGFNLPRSMEIWDCSGGSFLDPREALHFRGAKIKGNVYLCNIHAVGPVDGNGTTVEGDLDASSTMARSPPTHVQVFQVMSANIRHGVFLRKVFADKGVNLRGTTIGGDLICSGGTFKSEKGPALNASQTEIGGKVSLDDDFDPEGLLDFAGSHVTHEFVLEHVRLTDKMGVNLQFAKVATLLNKKDSWPKKGNLRLLGFTYDQIDPDARPDARIQLQWIHRQPDQFLAQPYNQLATALRRMGLDEEANTVLVAKNRDDGSIGKNLWTRSGTRGWGN
jgi:hypothetical protein